MKGGKGLGTGNSVEKGSQSRCGQTGGVRFRATEARGWGYFRLMRILHAEARGRVVEREFSVKGSDAWETCHTKGIGTGRYRLIEGGRVAKRRGAFPGWLGRDQGDGGALFPEAGDGRSGVWC